MHNWILRLFGSAALALFTAAQSVLPAHPHDKQKFDDRTADVLRWLPVEAQSIVHTPLLEEYLTSRDVGLLTSNFGYWQIYMLRPVWLLADMKTENADPISCFACVCKSSKNSINNPSCQFLFLKEGKDFAGAFDKVTEHAVKSYEDCGKTVKQLKAPGPMKELPNAVPFFVCYAAPGVVVGATDKDLMHTVLNRMQDPVAARVALPDSLPEWKTADVNAPFWGLRHFAQGDRTSPVRRPAPRRNGNDMNNVDYENIDKPNKGKPVDGKAIGMTFEYTPKKNIAEFTYYSSGSKREQAGRTIAGFDDTEKPEMADQPQSNAVTFKVDSNGSFPHKLFHNIARWLGEMDLEHEKF